MAVRPFGDGGLVVLRLSANGRPTSNSRDVVSGRSGKIVKHSLGLVIAIVRDDVRVGIDCLDLGNPGSFGCVMSAVI